MTDNTSSTGSSCKLTDSELHDLKHITRIVEALAQGFSEYAALIVTLAYANALYSFMTQFVITTYGELGVDSKRDAIRSMRVVIAKFNERLDSLEADTPLATMPTSPWLN